MENELDFEVSPVKVKLPYRAEQEESPDFDYITLIEAEKELNGMTFQKSEKSKDA